jgi:predicted nucleic acid-binding protein
VSFVLDASAAAALHFADEFSGFAEIEDALAMGTEVFVAPNFHQEVMEALRKAIRNGRTSAEDAAAWLTVLDSYNITVTPVHPCAGSATWLLAEQLNISTYDAGCIAIAKARGLPLFSRDAVILQRAPKSGVTVNPKIR